MICLRLPPSISSKITLFWPAKSVIVGNRSDPETGILISLDGFIPGPEITRGTLTPPSIASHLPLLNG